MTDEEMWNEIEGLKGRIAAIEGICALILGQLVHGDEDARRSIAESMRTLASTSDPGSASVFLRQAAESYLKISANIIRNLD